MSDAGTVGERSRPLRVLWLEDVPEDAELGIHVLRKAGYCAQYEAVADRATFRQRAQSGDFDLVLVDYSLPGWTGLDALRDLRAAGSELPVIFVTGSLGDETAVECLKQGASDYVLKHKLVRLPFAVDQVLRTRALQLEHQRAEREREHLLRDLCERERKYRELFELTNEAILIFEPQHEIILEANPCACATYGYARDELVGMSLKQLTGDVEAGERQIERLLAVGTQQNYETVHLSRDGSWICMLANAKVIDYAGQRAVLTVNRDITELKRAEADLRLAHAELEQRVRERTAELAKVNGELRRARDEWQSTFDCMSDAITVHDAAYNILRCNRAFREMFPGADLRSVKCYELVHGTQQPPDTCPMAQTLSSGRSENCEMFEPHLNKYISVRTDPINDADGNLAGIVHAVSDISERKEMERMKNDFVSCVSHELRTPLSSLRGFAELMLQREYPPEKQRHFLEIIYRESRRLEDLVNDVLDLQRIESGRVVLHFEPVSLPELVAETAELFSAPGVRHRIDYEVPPGFPPVQADAEAVRQILRNLVSNALKYSPEGGEIQIGVREQAGQALLWVSDQGIGIPADLVPHIFSKFYRAPNSAAHKIGGTGLGLAVVKGLVEAHQGVVWVESVPGKGSVFSFTLPIAHCTPASEAA